MTRCFLDAPLGTRVLALVALLFLFAACSSTSSNPTVDAGTSMTPASACRAKLTSTAACGACAASACQTQVDALCDDATTSPNTGFIETCFNGGACLPVARQTGDGLVDLARCVSGSCHVECALPAIASTSDADGCTCRSGADMKANAEGCTPQSAVPAAATSSCCRSDGWPAQTPARAMSRAVSRRPATACALPTCRRNEAISRAWLYRGRQLPARERTVLHGARCAGFSILRLHGRPDMRERVHRGLRVQRGSGRQGARLHRRPGNARRSLPLR